ncbi:MAG: ATP synthase subunit I [Myxococcota bacterium]|nr:ATP synthase subunit I [Myxococcota bacterium]
MKDEDGLTGEGLPEPVRKGIPRGGRSVLILAALLLIPTAVGAGTLGSPKVAVAVLCGGLLALGNFWLLARMVVQLTTGDDKRVSPLLVRILTKLAILGAWLYVLIVGAELDVVGLLLGLSVVIVSSLLSQVFGLLR